MKRRIVELENGKFSYQYRRGDNEEWTTSTSEWSSHIDMFETLKRWKDEESPQIKTIHEEI